jgi:hypothetical protein
MLGHCPGAVRVERLLRLTDAVQEIRQLGFGKRLDATAGGAAMLSHLPIPLRSVAEFSDIFPEAFDNRDTQYRSRLAGGGAWLPQAVQDFFDNGGEKLWVIRIPEEEGAAGFFPRANTVLHDTNTLAGLAVVLVLSNVGLVAFPDLERLQVPARLEDIPRLRLQNPPPRFIACSETFDDGHRERRQGFEIGSLPDPMPLVPVLRQILSPITRHRPDIQCLFTLPLAYSTEADSPAVDPAAIQELQTIRSQPAGTALRHMQLLFPYLRSARYSLHSPVGVLAGIEAGAARRQGIWRSVAGLPLTTDGKPYPKVSLIDAIQLRDTPGVGVLQYRHSRLKLDDERLAAPALHPADYLEADDPSRFDAFRSGEVARFLGFILRQLRALGESLVFNADPSDPRPRLVLERFFDRLFQQGALRGRLPEEAFSIRQRANTQESTIAYDIEIAPAFPIDHITLTFVNRSGDWEFEVSHA